MSLAWLSVVNDNCNYKLAFGVSNVDHCNAPSNRAHSDACPTISSAASLNRKEGQVKFKLAAFAKQHSEERF